MESVMEKMLSDRWRIGAVVRDNAGQCISFAHDLKNLVKAVLNRTSLSLRCQCVERIVCKMVGRSKDVHGGYLWILSKFEAALRNALEQHARLFRVAAARSKCTRASKIQVSNFR
ncbi:hypothetical protein GQ600_22057 [Phytophthora cactorum]|nr:hypothetical protein GQ600_22057 [Phytophthora cactorum]